MGFPKERIHVISNGIRTDNIKPINTLPFDGKSLNMVLIASNFESWHGLDRLVDTINTYDGPVTINLHLIGNSPNNIQFESINHTIICHGPLYDNQLIHAIFSKCNIAVSNLCLFRKNMVEACVLKSREYSLKGIPFIYAYNDTDIPCDAPFCLQLPNDDSSIDFEQIISFLSHISIDLDAVNLASKKFAMERLSWQSKLSQMIQINDL